jgi:hypothetical protein
MVCLVEITADAAGEGMEERRGRFLRLGPLIERFLRTHGGGAEDRGAALLSTLGGCLLDSLNDGFDPRARWARRRSSCRDAPVHVRGRFGVHDRPGRLNGCGTWMV